MQLRVAEKKGKKRERKEEKKEHSKRITFERIGVVLFLN